MTTEDIVVLLENRIMVDKAQFQAFLIIHNTHNNGLASGESRQARPLPSNIQELGLESNKLQKSLSETFSVSFLRTPQPKATNI